ncbi:hypothetical protein IGI04_039917 [Brassica rapa subsp. trilocularis]|uniref:Uncharacterized protein n=1 Tax=Brassica rapa subsp. trilocularis TaxID=1813537 RepID=A0ABQ7KQE6_BRACM|nr:hypothetical protein IGI04_039917 [Brassica rapa subsp. trilocularis]
MSMRNSPKMKKPLRERKKKVSEVRKERGLNGETSGSVDRQTEKKLGESRSRHGARRGGKSQTAPSRRSRAAGVRSQLYPSRRPRYTGDKSHRKKSATGTSFISSSSS